MNVASVKQIKNRKGDTANKEKNKNCKPGINEWLTAVVEAAPAPASARMNNSLPHVLYEKDKRYTIDK